MKKKEWKRIYNKYWGFKWWYSKKKRERILCQKAEINVDSHEDEEGNWIFDWEIKKKKEDQK